MPVKKQNHHEDHLPTWGIITIAVVIALVLGIIVYGMVKKTALEKLDKNLRSGIRELERNVVEDMQITGAAIKDVAEKTKTGADNAGEMMQKATVATSDDLKKLIEGKRAIDCRVTNVRTGQVAIYQAEDNFDEVRFEDANGGVIVDDDKMYVWDNKTMTGVKVKLDMDDLTQRMMMSTGATEIAAGQNIVVSCGTAKEVDLKRPKDIDFNETIKIVE